MNVTQGIQLLDRRLMDAVLEKARQSPRRRTNFNFHRAPEENPNRLLNAMLEGTYVAPHRHGKPPKAETFLVLEGQIALFVFDDAGDIRYHRRLGPGTPGGELGIDLAPGLWHTLAVLTSHAILLEIKPGPYDPATDKEFAPWAPHEGEPGAAAYLQALITAAQRA